MKKAIIILALATLAGCSHDITLTNPPKAKHSQTDLSGQVVVKTGALEQPNLNGVTVYLISDNIAVDKTFTYGGLFEFKQVQIGDYQIVAGITIEGKIHKSNTKTVNIFDDKAGPLFVKDVIEIIIN